MEKKWKIAPIISSEKRRCLVARFYDGSVCHEIERNCSFWSALISPEIKRSWYISMKKNGLCFFSVNGGGGAFLFLLLCS